jgi:hypothetical protein
MKIVSRSESTMIVGEQTERKTPRAERRSFGGLVGQAADLTLRGVEVGATLVGGPLVGAAVHGVRAGVATVAGSATPATGVPGGPTGPLGDGGAAGEQSTLDQVRGMQEQAQEFNLQFLALQEEVQQENRRFSTVSNVLKAKHETAKAAIGNIRS